MILDVHNHFYPPEYLDALKAGDSAVKLTIAVVLALGVVALLAAAGLIRAFVPVALGLTTMVAA